VSFRAATHESWAACAFAALALSAPGCGGGRHASSDRYVPSRIGAGPRFHPPAIGSAVARARPVASLRCERRGRRRFGVHLELFFAGRVVIVPAGIGVAPPQRRAGAYVRGGRCSYPLRTLEPTGVIEVAAAVPATLGDLFAVWGQPLGTRQFAGFRAGAGERVRAYVGGRRWRGAPRAIPLLRHAQIVLELGARVPPHATYRFRPGL
jgi:hypothetical protein